MSATDFERTREAELRILRERARKLAGALEDETHTEAMREIVRFRLGENFYAIDARHVFATRWLHELTPVPGSPPAIRASVVFSSRRSGTPRRSRSSRT